MAAEERPDILGEDIALPQGGRMDLQELVPRPPALFRPRIEAVLLENVLDRLPGNPVDVRTVELFVKGRRAISWATTTARSSTTESGSWEHFTPRN